MLEFQLRESGLVIPKDKPKPPEPPKRRYGSLELHDEAKRKLAEEALKKLWDAMDLSNPSHAIELPEHNNYDTYEKVWRFIGEMLLGEDCPEKEVKC